MSEKTNKRLSTPKQRELPSVAPGLRKRRAAKPKSRVIAAGGFVRWPKRTAAMRKMYAPATAS